MKLIADLQIKYKLALMLFLPTVGLLFFSVHAVKEKADIAYDMSQIEKLVQLSLKLSTIIHQIQYERHVSELFLKNQGQKHVTQLSEAATLTDQVITELNLFLTKLDINHYPTTFTSGLQQTQQAIDTLPSLRDNIAHQNITSHQAITNYSQINNQLIEFITYINNSYQNQNFTKLKLAYLNLVIAKERSALEGSLLSRIFKQRYFEPGEFRQFVELVSQQQVYLETITQRYLNDEQQAFLEKQLASKFIKETNNMRQLAYAASIDGIIKASLTDTENVVRNSISEHWFNMQTGKMEVFKAIENRFAHDLMTQSVHARNKAHAEFIITLSIILVIIFLTLLLVYRILIGITTHLSQAVNVASAISAGHLDTIVKVTTQDETGQLLQAFANMQTQLRHRIEADKQFANQLRQQMEENKRIATEALRINKALDSVTTHVFIADNDCNIIYLNKAAHQLLKQEGLPVVTNFSELDLEEWVDNKDGTNQHFSWQCQSLSQLTNSYCSRFKMRNLIIDSTVTPVINEQGKRLGIVAEFRDITVQTGLEQEINSVVQAVSQGDFQQRINLDNKTGFFQTFSDGINKIIDLNQVVVKDTMNMFSALAKGQLTQTIASNYAGVFEQLKNDANTTVQKLLDIIRIIKQAADAVNAGSDMISQSNFDLNQRTEQQAAALEETAASMEQLTSTVQQNADNAKQAKQLAIDARKQATQGGEIVNSTITAMSAINHSSQKVANIIGVIDEIAFQTNLLALNAAVEAARAGDKGRGFAVVATEVRNLAQRSATAAKEIKELIRDSVRKVEQGTQLVTQSGQTLEELVAVVKNVSDHIAEIAAASQEQSAGINQINKAITQMDEMTQQNATLVNKIAATSQSLATQAQHLIQQVAFFKLSTATE
jgi:methyl-accepting chemotaxis protein